MSRLLVIVIIINILVIFETSAARILCVIPTPAFSHQIVYRSVFQALAKRGHDVVLITTHPLPPEETPANLRQIDVFNASHHIWKDGISKVFHATGDDIKIAKIYFKMFTDIFETQIQSKPLQDLFKQEKNSFDVLLLESSVMSTVGLVNVFDAPAIQTSTFGPMLGTYAMFGVPTQPFLYPTSVHLRLYNLSIWEALNNLYKTAVYTYTAYNHEHEENKMLRRNLGMDILPLSTSYKKVNLYFQTVYPIWLCNPPVPPGIVYLGGLHQKPPNNLPQDLQALLDSADNGVIYVSFGTNVHPSLLCQEKIDMMAKVFTKLPYVVLWKRDQNIESLTAKNIHISTWFPQSDLLYHPKIKLFITQGGLQSTEEAITAAVPLIGIPIFGDQWMHSENYVRYSIGLQLDWSMLSEEQLTRSIADVTGNKSYKENVIRLRDVMNDQPQSALERALWWTEYAIKHGGTQHLFPASVNLSWLEYYEVKLLMIVVGVVILVLSLFSLTIIRLARYICRRSTNKWHSKII